MATKRALQKKVANVPINAVQLCEQLSIALRNLGQLPVEGARDVIILQGITPYGNFVVPTENVIQQLISIFVLRGGSPLGYRVYVYGQTVVLDTTVDGRESTLVPLRTGTKLESCAPSCLANLFVCEQPTPTGTVQFPIPPKALAVVLNAEPLVHSLHRIDLYARRPLFSPDFVLLPPGYHPKYRILIHGPEVEPDGSPLPDASSALDHLPPLLRELLGDFCFREPADLTNYLGLLLTGLLANRFLVTTKALALIDGNQPGVGKTLLMRILDVLLDGVDPHLIHYTTDEEELQKRICATLRPARQSVLVIDNAKQPSAATRN